MRGRIQLLDRDDLRLMLGWSYATIWRYLKRGLPHIRYGRELFFRKDEVLSWTRPKAGRPKADKKGGEPNAE